MQQPCDLCRAGPRTVSFLSIFSPKNRAYLFANEERERDKRMYPKVRHSPCPTHSCRKVFFPLRKESNSPEIGGVARVSEVTACPGHMQHSFFSSYTRPNDRPADCYTHLFFTTTTHTMLFLAGPDLDRGYNLFLLIIPAAAKEKRKGGEISCRLSEAAGEKKRKTALSRKLSRKNAAWQN